MKRPIIIVLIVLVVLVVFLVIGKKQGWIGKKFREKVTVEKAEFRKLTETITANGKIKPETEVKITSDVSGEIIDLLVKEGDAVKKGQILARIQPDIYQRNLEKMEAMVRNAESNVAQAEAQYIQKQLSFNRNKELYQNQTIATSDFELAEADYEVAKANLASSKASLKNATASLNEARDNLSKTTLYAPMEGTISRLKVEKGERVVGTAQFEGTDIMTLANLNNMEVVVEVNENDIVRVKLNDTCLIEVDAYLKHQFKGIVTQIANSANIQGTSADQITNFEVRIFILPESYSALNKGMETGFYPLRPGMSATVDIQTKTIHHALTIPIQSVTLRTDSIPSDSLKVKEKNEDAKTEVAFLVKEGKVIQQKVETGIQDSKYIQILEGLAENDEVVSGPYSAIARKLKDGDLVDVTTNLNQGKNTD